jgi:DNA repair exonuclease SbcCD ATPase subunit
MSDQATPSPTAQSEPTSTGTAITNLRSALDSIASNDLSITPPKEEQKPNPSQPSPENTGVKANEPKQQESKNNDSAGGEEAGKTEADNTDAQTEVEPSGDKEKIRWKELKQAEKELKLAQKELSELKALGSEYEQASKEVQELKSQIEEIQKEREAIDGELYMTRVQATKEWKQYVSEPLNEIIDNADFFAQRNKVDTGDLIDALQADTNGDPQKLEALMADWSERDKSKVWTLADNLLQIEKRKEELEANSKEAYNVSMERQKKEEQEFYNQYYAQRESAIQEVVPKMAEKVFNLLPEDKRPDMDKLQKEVMSYDDWPENLKVYGILGAAVLPDLLDTVKSLQAELKETKENNVKLRGGSAPAAGGNSPKTPAEANKPTDYTKMDTDDFVKNLVGRMVA